MRGKIQSILLFLASPLITLSFEPQIAAQDPVDPGALFLESFGSACSSRGVFTQKALSQTEALKKILETIKNDPACQGLTPLFNSLVDVSAQIDSNYNFIQNSKEEDLDDYILRLEYLLAISSSPYEQSYLAQEIADARVRRAYVIYEQGAQIQANRAYATSSLVNYLETLNMSYANHLLCFERNKSVPIQLAGHLLSLAGAFFDPSLGLAMTVAGRLVSSFFSFFDNLKLVNRIKDYRKTTMMAGLTCAMEALEQTVCDIQDRRSLLNKIEDYREHDPISEEWMGYEILTREYPTVQTFLRRVEAGSPASSTQQGNQRAKYRIREGNFNAIVEKVWGAIGQTETELAAIPIDDLSGRFRRLRTLTYSIAGNLLAGDENIFKEIIPDSDQDAALLWLRVGNPTPLIRDADGDQKSRKQILSELESGAGNQDLLNADAVRRQDVSAMRANLMVIITAAQAQLDIERQINIIADQQGALIGWTTRDGRTFTAGVVMEKIVAYFKNLELVWSQNLEWFDNSPERQRDQIAFVADTRQRFERVVDILRAKNDDRSPDPLAEKLKQIYQIMVLKEKDTVISDRMKQIVIMDMEKRLRAGLLVTEENLDVTVRLGTQDIIFSLSPGSTQRIEPLKVDLDFAEPIARDNIRHFFTHFREPLRDSIQHLLDQAAVYKEGVNGVSRRLASKMCILALNDPNVFIDQKLVDLCDRKWIGVDDRGLVAHDYLGQPIFASFDAKVAALEAGGWRSPEDRLCTYRRYQNNKELHLDILRHRPSRFFPKNTPPQGPGATAPFQNASFDPFSDPKLHDQFRDSR